MPTYPLRHLTTDDIPAVLALFEKVGWRYTAPALKQLLMWCGQGAFAITYRKTIIATSTAIMYGQQRGWIGMVVTDPAYQGQGFGGRITDTAVDHLKTRRVREIMLDASMMGKPVYQKRGFRDVGIVHSWRGISPAEPPAINHPEIRPIRQEDVETVIALDAHAFGVERPQVIKTLMSARGNRGWLISERGFIIAQAWHAKTVRLGTWNANNPDDAEALLLTAMNALPDYQLFLFIPEANQAAVAILEKHNFAVSSTVTRMIQGDVPDPLIRTEQYYGAVNLAVG